MLEGSNISPEILELDDSCVGDPGIHHGSFVTATTPVNIDMIDPRLFNHHQQASVLAIEAGEHAWATSHEGHCAPGYDEPCQWHPISTQHPAGCPTCNRAFDNVTSTGDTLNLSV